jgi:uncharacterized membrane protein YccC
MNVSSNGQRADRVYRALKFLGKIAKVAGGRGGFKAASKLATKANLALAAVDAVVSVIDACAWYCRLKQAREETKQLVAQIAAAQKELTGTREELAQQFEVAEDSLKNDRLRFALLARTLKETKRLLDHVEQARNSIAQDENLDVRTLRQIDFKYERALASYSKAADLVLDEDGNPEHLPEGAEEEG